MQLTRRAGLGLAAAAATALALGVPGVATAQEGKSGGTLVAAFSADPGGFDPARGPSGMSHVVIEQVYSTLLNLDENAKPYAGIAESWSVADDGLSWTFTLRPDLYEDDGFREIREELEAAARWKLVKLGEPLQALPKGEPDVFHQLWVFKATIPSA